jgi:hypothetical protein
VACFTQKLAFNYQLKKFMFIKKHIEILQDVDQGTGEDLNPTRMRHNMPGESSTMTRNPDR